MDVLSFIQNNGLKEVANPDYKPNSKKNTQPATIKVPDITADNDNVIGLGVQNALTTKSISGKEADKYAEYGLTWRPNDNMNELLANAQSSWSKLGHGLAQTVVSELGIGTVKGFSDLIDMVGQLTGISDENYSNPFTQYLEEKQEEFKNWMPVYTNEGVNISNGGLINMGWWASNLPSIASSLTLLVPSSLVTRGLSYAGKASKIGAFGRKATRVLSGAERALKEFKEAEAITDINELNKLNKLQRVVNSNSTANKVKLFLENGTTAAFSRAMENYQEARQSYNDMYIHGIEKLNNMSDSEYQEFINNNKDLLYDENGNSVIDVNDKDAVAKAVAKASADRTFQMDWINIVSDVIEMYALRNAWKGLKNAPSDPVKVRRANIDAAKYQGKTLDEIAVIKSQRKWAERAKEWAADNLYGSKLAVAGQLSEGVEEAVNYIAQEEGSRLGKILLGEEEGSRERGFGASITSMFDPRIFQYAGCSELWDSAFWGVMGGVVFQGLGSKFNQIKNKFDEKSDATEGAKNSKSWFKLDDMPEIKRRLSEFDNRTILFNKYVENLKKINEGIDVAKSTTENQVKFENEVEQDVAREKLFTDLATEIGISAMNSGNLDMLKAYLADDNLRKGMIEAGVFSTKKDGDNRSQEEIDNETEKESREFISKMINKIEQVEEMYDNEIVAIDYASSYINSTSGVEIPAEYMQIMATSNIRTRFDIEKIDEERNKIERRIQELVAKHQDTGDLDANVDYENACRAGVYANLLKNLYLERNELNKDLNSLSNRLAIKEVNKRINLLESKLDDAELAWAVKTSLSFKLDESGKQIYATDEESLQRLLAHDKEIIDGYKNIKEGETSTPVNIPGMELYSDRAKTPLNAESSGKARKIYSDSKATFEQLNQIDAELNNHYKTKAALEIEKEFALQRIIRNTNQVSETANYIHNTMDEARKTAINNANKTIGNAYRAILDKGLDTNEFREVILSAYNRKNTSAESLSMLNEVGINPKDVIDALEVLDVTKPYNTSLLATIEKLFDMEDVLNAQRETVYDKKDGENNTGKNQAKNSSPTLDEVISSSKQSNKRRTRKESQTEHSGEPLDPQNLEGRKPIYYIEFNSQGQSINHSKSKKTKAIPVYDNNDGTYTLDIRGNLEFIHNPQYMIGADTTDLTRPYEVTVLPVCKKSNNGRFIIGRKVKGEFVVDSNFKQGEIRNTDVIDNETHSVGAETQTEETVDETESTSSTGEREVSDETSNNGETESDDGESNDGKSDDESSTVTPPAVITTSSGKILDSTDVPEIDLNYIAYNIAASIFKQYKNANNTYISKNELFEESVKQIMNSNTNINREAAETATNWAINKLNERLNKQGKTVLQSSVTELMFQSATLCFNNKYLNITKDFIGAVKEVIDNYSKEVGITKINGKTYINLEDMLRYINKTCNDNTTASILFSGIKTYLISEEGNKDFILTDKEELNKSDFLDNVNKSQDERDAERHLDKGIHRVDIYTFAKEFKNDKEELDKFYEALDELQVNDQLNIVRSGSIIYLTDSKGRKIGRLPVPNINSNGAYEMTNDGWITDVIEVNGETVSKLKDLFLNWASGYNDGAKQLNNIIMEWAYSNPDDKRKKELLAAFNNNSEIKYALDNGFASTGESSQVLLSGLASIWKYLSPKGSIDLNNLSTSNKIYFKMSLESWFNNLYNEYSFVNNLNNGKEKICSVAEISDGELIRAQERVTSIQALPVASEAIAGGIDIDKHKIAITDSRGNLNLSGGGVIPFAAGQYNTFVIIPNRSGRNGYVQAYPQRLGSDTTTSPINENLGNDAKEIVQTIHTEIDRLLDEHKNKKTHETIDNLIDFLKSTFSNADGNTSLFYDIPLIERPTGDNKQIIIGNKESGNIVFYRSSNYNGVKKPGVIFSFSNDSTRYNINNNEDVAKIKTRFHEIINSGRYNLSQQLITSDSYGTYNLKGLCSKKDGKFTIKVGDKTWTYSSFNEFVLKNDVVKLNTEAKDGSNFTRRGVRSQAANQVLKVRMSEKDNSKSPIEGMKNKSVKPDNTTSNNNTTSDSNTPIDAKSILTSTDPSIDKGFELAKLVFGDKAINTILNTKLSTKRIGLLPKNIIFDENFNSQEEKENINAEIVIDKKSSNYGNVRVGQKWLDMFNNPETRQIAMQKLFHEQVHYILSENPGYVKSIQDVYDEFKEALNTPINTKEYNDFIESIGVTDEEFRTHAKQYLFEDYDDMPRLEEFLIESLTNKQLAVLLNNIEAKDSTKTNRKNLLTKLFNVLRDIFGWGIDVKVGSLYEKELNTIRYIGDKPNSTTANKVVKKNLKGNGYIGNLFDDFFDEKDNKESEKDTNDKTQKEEPKKDDSEQPKKNDKAEAIIKQITDDGKNLELTADEKFYVDKTTGKLYSRVTTVIAADEATDGKHFDPNSPWVTPSTNIGTGVDEFVRDFFLGKLDKLDDEALENTYPNADGYSWSEFLGQLKEFKKGLEDGTLIKGKRITIVSRDIHASGEITINDKNGNPKTINVTGTLDLIGYDENGEFYIFDMKTIHSTKVTTDKSDKWNRQLQLYKQFLTNKYGIKVNDCFIIPIKVNYPAPDKDNIYTVRNPEEKTNYDNPMRTQLLRNGEEYRNAQPMLGDGRTKLYKMKPKEVNAKYDYLDDWVKDVVDGKITADTYLNPQPVEVPKTITTSNKFGVNNSSKLKGMFGHKRSSVTEIINGNIAISSNVSSLRGFVERLPIAEQLKFISSVERGEVSVSCR